MALKQETIEVLAKNSRFDSKELAEAIAAEEERELTINELQVFTPDELATRTTNEIRGVLDRYSQKELNGVQITGDTPDDMVHGLGKKVYDDSKTASLEMWVKDQKRKNGWEFTGNSPDDLLSYVRSQKGDTGELESTIEKLRANITGKDDELSTLKSEYEKKLSQISTRQEAMAAIPDNLIDTIKKDQVLQLFLATHEIDKQGDTRVVKKNGEVIKDAQLLNPKPLEVILKDFVETNGWLAADKRGRGGEDKKAVVTGVEHIHDADTFFEYLSQKGIHRGSIEAVNVLNKLPKETQEAITNVS